MEYSPIGRAASGVSSGGSGGIVAAPAEGGWRVASPLPILQSTPQIFDLATPPVPFPPSAEGG
eukprot:12518114-Prorocentrum_lima.AAC.1